jgi:hypothetical protein
MAGVSLTFQKCGVDAHRWALVPALSPLNSTLLTTSH